LAVTSTMFSWALMPLALGLGYIAFYCSVCARSADLSILAKRPDRAPWFQRLKWRGMIGWLHFLEPLARDWGRLKGGLTPWRPALAAEPDPRLSSRWWQRVQPFTRKVMWQYPGGMRLEKHAILERVTTLLASRGCAVAWNPDYEPWDIRLRRGALGEASIRMVVEHHGGPRRVARFAAAIKPNGAISCALGILALAAGTMVVLRLPLPAAGLGALLGLLWFASIREADRLEAGLLAATDRVCRDPATGDPSAG
jgi:hypothetical protein